MNPRFILFAIVSIIVFVLLWRTASSAYFAPRQQLRADIASAQADIEEFERVLDGRLRLQRDMRSIQHRTLGGDVETVDHRLRTRLNRLVEEVELRSATVSTGSPAARTSPASARFRGSAPILREMREMIDFTELEGSISGEGTLEQIVRLIDRIEAEPWIKRLNFVRIDPRQDGQRFGITLRLSTLFLPGLSPAETAREQFAYDEERLVRYASLIQTNPFRVPPPPPPEVAREPSQERPPAPPKFPYEQWLVTGLAEGADSNSGGEVWLRNRSSGEKRTLRPGQKLHEAAFVGIYNGAGASAGDHAEFRLAEERFLVAVGGHLGDRTPVNQ